MRRVEELAYELTAREVMSIVTASVSPGDPMSHLLTLLRDQNVSGAPVVSDGKLVGIVSVQDLIGCLQSGKLDAPVSDFMATGLITVRRDDLVIKVMEQFDRTRVGRLPVVDENGCLVGIITKGDITSGVLKALQSQDGEEDIRRYRASHLFEDIDSDRTSLVLRYRIKSGDFDKGGQASVHIKRALLRLGADPSIARRTAIASYEAEMNLVIHTTRGGLVRVEIQPQSIHIQVVDDGPGIPDVEKALQPGFSTASEEIRALGFGAGFGLKNIERNVDQMWLKSKPGSGTRLEMRIYLKPDAAQRDLEATLERLALHID
ncbi:MAG: CBS domain-containing protein [Anaerolineales bacterium]|nr:CBS domain-containing protein [Anaerolineales bacterium]